MNEQFLIANISWNPFGWRNVYTNPKAGHKYARENPGHESLNFKFNKKGVDTDEYIFGFFQCRSKPVKFLNGGTIIFYSHNTDTNKGQIVGMIMSYKVV